jgi:hypothetical protein
MRSRERILSNVSNDGERPPWRQNTYKIEFPLLPGVHGKERNAMSILTEQTDHLVKRIDLIFYKSCERQIIKQIREVLPNVCISILPQAFIVEAIPVTKNSVSRNSLTQVLAGVLAL